MNSERAKRVLRANAVRINDELDGMAPDALRLSAFRISQITTADTRKQPASETVIALQTVDKVFKFLLGYSALGGGDILG